MTPHAARNEDAIVQAAERERRSLADGLHDSLAQTLSAIALQARLAQRQLGATSPAASDAIGEFGRLLQAAGTDLRDLLAWLSPASLELGLREGLLEIADAASRRVPCHVRCPDDVEEPDTRACQQILAIARDAVWYFSLSSGVGEIALGVEMRDGELSLEVRADGEGHIPRALMESGLTQHRANAIGATVVFGPAGVRCVVPLPRAGTAHAA